MPTADAGAVIAMTSSIIVVIGLVWVVLPLLLGRWGGLVGTIHMTDSIGWFIDGLLTDGHEEWKLRLTMFVIGLIAASRTLRALREHADLKKQLTTQVERTKEALGCPNLRALRRSLTELSSATKRHGQPFPFELQQRILAYAGTKVHSPDSATGLVVLRTLAQDIVRHRKEGYTPETDSEIGKAYDNVGQAISKIIDDKGYRP